MDYESVLRFLEQHSVIIVMLHILGASLGLGGATIADLLFFRFLKDFRISKKEAEVLHILAAVVMTAIILLIVSGIGIFLPNAAEFSRSPAFLVKSIAVGVLTINGVALHIFVAPHLIHLSFVPHPKGEQRLSRGWHRLAFLLGSISFSSWYTAFLIAMLKSIIPWTFGQFLSAYLAFLVCAIVGGQIMEGLFKRQGKHFHARTQAKKKPQAKKPATA